MNRIGFTFLRNSIDGLHRQGNQADKDDDLQVVEVERFQYELVKHPAHAAGDHDNDGKKPPPIPFAVSFLFEVPKNTHESQVLGEDEIVNEKRRDQNRKQIAEIRLAHRKARGFYTSDTGSPDNMCFCGIERVLRM